MFVILFLFGGLITESSDPTFFVGAKEPVRLVQAVTGNPITGPTGGRPGNILVLDASAAQADSYGWSVIPRLPNNEITILPMPNGRAQVASVLHEVEGFPKGRYFITLGVVKGGQLTFHEWTIQITNPAPIPPQPLPPQPVPPQPTPDPKNLRAVIIYESSSGFDRTVMLHPDLKLYLDSHTKEWRRFDKDQPVALQSQEMKDLIRSATLAASSNNLRLPIIAVTTNGTDGDVIELPKTIGEALAHVKKWGGP